MRYKIKVRAPQFQPLEQENLSERCPTCGKFTSFEENYGYLHNDDPSDSLTGTYCDERCLDRVSSITFSNITL